MLKAERAPWQEQHCIRTRAQPEPKRYDDDCYPTFQGTTSAVKLPTTTPKDADHGKASPPDVSDISRHEAAMRAYAAACKLHNSRYTEARFGSSSSPAAAATATTTNDRLASIDRQSERIAKHAPLATTVATTRHTSPSSLDDGGSTRDNIPQPSHEDGMNTGMVEGDVNTAKPFNILSTSTNDEVGMNTAIPLTDLKLNIAARGLLDAVVIPGDAVVHYHSCNAYEARRAMTTDHDTPSTAHNGLTNCAEQLTTTTGTMLYDKSAATNMRLRAVSSNDDERAHEGHVIHLHYNVPRTTDDKTRNTNGHDNDGNDFQIIVVCSHFRDCIISATCGMHYEQSVNQSPFEAAR